MISSERFASRMAAVRPWGTLAIFVLCTLVFVFELVLGGNHTSTYVRLGAISAPLVRAGQWWRLVASMFVHLGWLHFIVNMYSLYAVCPAMEKMYGTWRFLVVYFVAGVAASAVASYTPMGLAAGASGALFGVVGAALCLGFRYRHLVPPRLGARLRRIMTIVVVFNLGLGFTINAALKAYHSTVAVGNSMHVAGLVAGFLVAALLLPAAVDDRPRVPLVAGLVVGFLALAPFGVQLGVLGRAIFTKAPDTLTYHDPGGRFRFQYPAGLEPIAEKDGIVLAGDEFEMWVSTKSDGFTREQELDDTVAQLDKDRMHVLSSSARSIGKRNWRLLEARNSAGYDITVAITDAPGGAAGVETIAEKSGGGEAARALEIAMQSFQTP